MSIRKKILSIDPNSLHLDLLKENLPNGKYQIQLTKSPGLEQAKKLLKSTRFDLILSEYFDPQIYGEWIESLTKDSKGTPVIIITTCSDQKKAILAIKKGATDYITKNKETIQKLSKTLAVNLDKKKKRSYKLAAGSKRPIRSQITRHLKTLTQMINNPAKGIAIGKKQMQTLEKELDYIKGNLKNWLG